MLRGTRKKDSNVFMEFSRRKNGSGKSLLSEQQIVNEKEVAATVK
jgi:hypothetical protein